MRASDLTDEERWLYMPMWEKVLWHIVGIGGMFICSIQF